ncbi:MAG: AraC family transcriptional regulator [Acidobacteriota bacterium]
MDVLSDILDATRLRGTLYFTTSLSPPWGIRVPRHGLVARFHLVARGRLWVRLEGEEPTCLETGDLVLVPRGAPHDLLDDPTTPACELDDVLTRSGFTGEGTLVHGGEDTDSPTRLACGHFTLDEHVEHPLLEHLPSCLILRRGDDEDSTRLADLIAQVMREATQGELGCHAVVRRLSEVLFIQALRAWARRSAQEENGLAALADPQLGASLERLHERPGDPWTLESLARAAGLSRTVFAQRFKEALGMPAMKYLTSWRMQRARRLLVESEQTLEAIAEDVGYESAPALSRVFKRWVGVPPGQYRREHARGYLAALEET